jgi:hypothetical protein
MITFETSVCVMRPINDVFGFVSDPLLFPQWNYLGPDAVSPPLPIRV